MKPNKFWTIPALIMIAVSLLIFQPKKSQAQSGDDAARAVISNQLEAFLAKDFDLAYSFAANNIKQIYPTLDSFMAMVKGGYLPVLSPGNYAFGKSEAVADGRIMQDLLIRAPDGSDWTATYFMELRPDGTWKIAGVSLRKGAAGMT